MAQHVKKDTVTKAYMSDCEIFADVFNQFLYDGRRVIQPNQLREMDTTAATVPYGDSRTDVSVQRFRDVFKAYSAKKCEDAVYLLLGIENQSELHFAMPVRNMLYDALAYTEQVECTAKNHRRERKQKKGQKREAASTGQAEQEQNCTSGRSKVSGQPLAAEYLSGFYKDDRLIPVVTLVMYFGADIWDAPKSLHEMLSVRNEKILSFVPDYRLNLIAPAQMSEEEIDQFTTSFREVLLFIKYSADKEKLRTLIEKDAAFRRVDRKAARVISAVTGTKLQLDESKEAVDMCLAIDEMCKEERMEGRMEGRREGRMEGRCEGRIENRVETAQRMLLIGKYDLEDIAYISGLPIEEVRELQKLG